MAELERFRNYIGGAFVDPGFPRAAPMHGLAAAITANAERLARVEARDIRASAVWTNADRGLGPSAPVGGCGHSGIGRENGADALHEYTETRSIWVELTGATRDPFKLG